MSFVAKSWKDPLQFLLSEAPERPVYFTSPRVLANSLREFQNGFHGLVTFAVKANPDPTLIGNLMALGMGTFDVASAVEIEMIRALSPDAVLHYHNPVRSVSEIRFAVAQGVRSYSVDSFSELTKLAGLVPKGTEIAVRLKLPVDGAAYDFGEKFGASAQDCVALLREVERLGLTASMTFHPGTQCETPLAWEAYIAACADIAREAGVTLARLNVGGGFPSWRKGEKPELQSFFDQIYKAAQRSFEGRTPDLVCEPGRALVAEAYSLAVKVKAIRDGGPVFLNDGIYGSLREFSEINMCDRITVVSKEGIKRNASWSKRDVFGPTCDSIDKLPDGFCLPDDLAEGDYILIHGMGAYVKAVATPFNGYGDHIDVTVEKLSA